MAKEMETITQDEFRRRFPLGTVLSTLELVRVESAIPTHYVALIVREDKDRTQAYICDALALQRELKDCLQLLSPTSEDRILESLRRIENLLKSR